MLVVWLCCAGLLASAVNATPNTYIQRLKYLRTHDSRYNSFRSPAFNISKEVDLREPETRLEDTDYLYNNDSDYPADATGVGMGDGSGGQINKGDGSLDDADRTEQQEAYYNDYDTPEENDSLDKKSDEDAISAEYDYYEDEKEEITDDEPQSNLTKIIGNETISEVLRLKKEIKEYAAKTGSAKDELHNLQTDPEYKTECSTKLNTFLLETLINDTKSYKKKYRVKSKQIKKIFINIQRKYFEKEEIQRKVEETLLKAETAYLKNEILQGYISLLQSRKENHTAALCHELMKSDKDTAGSDGIAARSVHSSVDMDQVQWLTASLSYAQKRYEDLQGKIALERKKIDERHMWCENSIKHYQKQLTELEESTGDAKRKYLEQRKKLETLELSITTLNGKLSKTLKHLAQIDDDHLKLKTSLYSYYKDIECYKKLEEN